MSNNFWRGRNVFLTGATGFLGTWLVQELLARRADVVAWVRNPSSVSGLRPEMTAILQKLTNSREFAPLHATCAKLAGRRQIGALVSQTRSNESGSQLHGLVPLALRQPRVMGIRLFRVSLRQLM